MGGKVRMYLPKDHPVQDWKRRISECVFSDSRDPLIGPLSLELNFVFTRPKTVKRKGWKDTKPDLDNVVKACMDALTNANVWEDDKQVCELTARKRWAEPHETPRAEFILKTL
tara:strand:+ start:318 stop:656 length:339 start_codon:yes stop_codon:yes gene_type:complete